MFPEAQNLLFRTGFLNVSTTDILELKGDLDNRNQIRVRRNEYLVSTALGSYYIVHDKLVNVIERDREKKLQRVSLM